MGRGRARPAYLGPQLPRGSRQASSSRLPLVRKRQKEVTEAAPPSPSQAGKTPPQWSAQEGVASTDLQLPRSELPVAGTHLHAFWAVVPRGADVSRESLRGGREQGLPMGLKGVLGA